MKKLIIGLLLAAPTFGQSVQLPTTSGVIEESVRRAIYNANFSILDARSIAAVPVAGLPPAAGNLNLIRAVLDGTTGSPCGVGGSTVITLCISTGAAWVPLSSGGSASIPAGTLGTYAARPACASGIAGQLFFVAPALTGLCDPNSLTWRWFFDGESITPPPALGSFTAVGAGSIASDSSGAALVLISPSGSDPAIEAALLAVPSGTAYDLVIGFTVTTRANEAYMTCGLAMSDGTSTSSHLAGPAVALWDGRRYSEFYTTYASVVSHLANTDGNGGAAMTRGALFWARINRNGSTFTFYEAANNGDWGPPVFQTSALGFTPTHYGPYCDSRSATPVSITVRHLSGG